GEPDFRVRYMWLPPAADGLVQRPHQHLRCDFAYAGDDIGKTGVYMIWPEFEDALGRPIPEGAEVPASGTATMWIVSREEFEDYHRERVRPGVRGFFMVGARRIAEVEVIEVLHLSR